MPSTGNFRRLVAGSTGQRKSILRNLVSSLIIHESITTTLAKAKAVQPYAEQVITMGKKYSGRRDQRDRATAYLYDWKITLPKLFDTLATRYSNRPGGYTRIHKLPPRYGDQAPLAILELVDGKRDMLFSMTARRVARSAILGTKWLSESTKDAMFRIYQFTGQERIKDFDKEVELQKQILLREDTVYAAWRKRKEEKPIRDLQDRIDERSMYTVSRGNRKKVRELEEHFEDKKRRDAYISEEEKRAAKEKETKVQYRTDGEENAEERNEEAEEDAGQQPTKRKGGQKTTGRIEQGR